MKIRLTYAGRQYDIAERLPRELELADGTSLADALRAVAERFPEGTRLPESCLVAVSGTHVGTVAKHQPRLLHDGDELLLLAPVAGG